MKNVVRVGVGVMILKDGKVLLAKRKGSHGAGEFAFPGGHLEFKESIKECARREVFEESGIQIKNIKFSYFRNLTQYAEKHYAHIGVVADWKSGKPTVKEPDKCEGWGWYELDHLPQPLFGAVVSSIEAYQSGKIFFDSN